MMSWLITTSLRMRVLIVALALLLTYVGMRTTQMAAFDVFPEFAPPLVEIQTEAPGLSTEEVESLVTVALKNALHGAPWVKTIRSQSVLGLSSVVLIFEPGTDLLRERQMVQERIAVEAARLPSVAHAPVMLSPLSSTSRALKIGVTSKKLSQMEMTELAKWTIRPRLMSVPGVANVAIWGQRDRQYQVLVDPARLRAHELTLDAVVRAAGDAVVVSGGGFIDSPNQRLAVRHLSPVIDAEDLARTVVVFRNGASIRLGDVAEVRIDHPAPIGDAVINDVPGLLLIVEKQPWGSTLSVTRDVEAALEALKPGLKDIEMDPTIFRPATFIERSLVNLRHALLLGCGLVVVILFAFFFEWRAAFISLITIPLSLLAAGIVLHFLGGTINTMVLAGLVIAVGVVVDDAIIDVENIQRRLRLNRLSPTPLPLFKVVLDASLEVRSAVVLASFIVILVFVPVFFLPGLAGSFFRPLALAYVLAILASMFVALTLTPALSLMLLPRAVESARSPLSQWLQRRYRALLPRFITRPGTALLVLLVAFTATGIAIPMLGEEFLPNFKETDFLMHWVEKPGTSLDAMRRITELASKEVLTGASATIVVRTFGPDMELLRAQAKNIADVMGKVPGVTTLKIEPQVLVPQVTVRMRPEAAEQFGLTAGQVRRAATTLVQGAKVGEVFQQQRAYAVTVWGAETVRSDVTALGDLLIDLPGGGQVPLRDVAEISVEPAPNEIKREGASRRLDVTCNAAGRDLGSVAREIEQAVRGLDFPQGYHPEFLGEYAARQESQRQLMLLAGLAVLGILVLLHVEFQSWRLTWLVFLTLPFALIGGVCGAFLTGGVLSLGSLIGFVTVLGVAARNGIMLLSHYHHLESVEGVAFGPELILRGAEERLTPILMTALCTGLALVPLALAGNKPGHEIEYPMAVVILGGLITSTLLNLVLMPALYGRFGRSPAK